MNVQAAGCDPKGAPVEDRITASSGARAVSPRDPQPGFQSPGFPREPAGGLDPLELRGGASSGGGVSAPLRGRGGAPRGGLTGRGLEGAERALERGVTKRGGRGLGAGRRPGPRRRSGGAGSRGAGGGRPRGGSESPDRCPRRPPGLLAAVSRAARRLGSGE